MGLVIRDGPTLTTGLRASSVWSGVGKKLREKHNNKYCFDIKVTCLIECFKSELET